MDEEIIIRTIEHQENQILSMRREMNGIHASITNAEERINRAWLVIVGVSVIVAIVSLLFITTNHMIC